MRAEFVETSEFTATIREYLNDEDYSNLQRLLMEQPNRGVVIPGCNGLRKLRVANESRGKGKRGGCRGFTYTFPKPAGSLCLTSTAKTSRRTSRRQSDDYFHSWPQN